MPVSRAGIGHHRYITMHREFVERSAHANADHAVKLSGFQRMHEILRESLLPIGVGCQQAVADILVLKSRPAMAFFDQFAPENAPERRDVLLLDMDSIDQHADILPMQLR